jgi:endonuclease/exonuclease/phosphatase family metal-dependent hydrolase
MFEKKGPPKSAESKQALAQVLRAVDGDVCILQEVESQQALENFLSEQGLTQTYQNVHVFQTNDPGGRNLAVLSKHPILETLSHADRTFPVERHGHPTETRKFARDVAEALIPVSGIPFRVFNVHYKADPFYGKPHSPDDDQKAKDVRKAEETETRVIMGEERAAHPGEIRILGGDMNDDPDSVAITDLVKGGNLVDPLAPYRTPEDYSHPATHDRMDYLLFEPAAEPAIDGVGVYQLAPADIASDHRPVVVDVDLAAAARLLGLPEAA